MYVLTYNSNLCIHFDVYNKENYNMQFLIFTD